MKDKEKQITEMAKEIFNTCAWRFGKPNDYKEIFNDIAEDLIKLNYRKIPEDSVVLSKEEYRCLKSIEKSYDPFWFCAFGGCEGACKECKDTCEMSIFVKERKETAEKIYLQAKTIVDATKYIVQGREYLHIDALKEIVKACNVEIKE